MDNSKVFGSTYPINGDSSAGSRYTTIQQLGPALLISINIASIHKTQYIMVIKSGHFLDHYQRHFTLQ